MYIPPIMKISVLKDKNYSYSSLSAQRVTFYLILFITFMLLFGLSRIQLVTYYDYLVPFVKQPLADASVFTFICILFRGRWKIISLLIPFAVMCVLMANVLYCRFFNDVIPGPLYFAGNALNNHVTDGAQDALRWYDGLFILIAALPSMYAWKISFRRFYEINPDRNTYLACSLLLIFFVGMVIRGVYKGEKKRRPQDNVVQTLRNTLSKNGPAEWISTFTTYGLTGYLIRCLIYSDQQYMVLNAGQLSEIISHIEQKNRINKSAVPIDTVKVPKNLLVIVVESWPSKTYSLENAEYIMPNIMSYAKDSAAVYGALRQKIELGHSSDGQFIYNTGALPLRSEPFVVFYAYNDFPSIAKAFGHFTGEIIGERETLWNHSLTSKSYGYDRLTSHLCDNYLNQDSIIFRETARQIAETGKNPFYLFITTLGMHAPYAGRSVSRNLDPKLLGTENPNLIEYYQRLNYMDRHLGKLIESLKAQGKYDETLIVIAGDHTPFKNDLPETMYDDKVAFMILNSPRTDIVKSDFTQLDLFPTILYLMNLKAAYKGMDYTGFGYNMFVDTDRHLTEEDYKLSEWIIRSRPE